MHKKCGSLTAACFSLVLLASIGSALTSITDHKTLSKTTTSAQLLLASRPHGDYEIVTGTGAIVDLNKMNESSAVRVGCGGSIATVYIAEAMRDSLSIQTVLGWFGAFALLVITCACLPAGPRRFGFSVLNFIAICSVPFVSVLLPAPLDTIAIIGSILFAIGYVISVAARSLYKSAGLLMQAYKKGAAKKASIEASGEASIECSGEASLEASLEAALDARLRATSHDTTESIRQPVHPNYPNQRRSNAYVNFGCPKSADRTDERSRELASIR